MRLTWHTLNARKKRRGGRERQAQARRDQDGNRDAIRAFAQQMKSLGIPAVQIPTGQIEAVYERHGLLRRQRQVGTRPIYDTRRGWYVEQGDTIHTSYVVFEDGSTNIPLSFIHGALLQRLAERLARAGSTRR